METPRVFRFGPFAVDTEARELSKDGTRIKLRGHPYLILEALLARAGKVVTREEIRKRLWPADTFVDFEHGLNTSVKKLREVLCDSADEPRYIETVPRVGYRFIVPVETLESPQHASDTSTDLQRLKQDTESHKSAAVREAAPFARDRRVVWIAGGVVVIAAAVLVGDFFFRHPAKLTEKDSIVLADFDNTTGERLFDGTLKQAVSADLEQSPFLNVLSEQRVTGTLHRMGRASNEIISEPIAMEICLRTGSKAVLAGSIASLGSHYAIALKALNCQTEDSIGIAKAEAAGREKVLQALDSAVTSVRAKLGESRISIEKFNHALEEVTTSSLPALQAYSESIRVQQEHGDPEAIPLLKRALELDPNFALAYARVGVAYSNLGQAGLAIDNLTKAFELRQRSSERESFYISTQYYTFVTGQVEKANQELQLCIQEYPRDSLAHLDLGDNYALLGQYQKAVAETRESLRLEPNSVLPYGNLALFSLALNRVDDTETTFREALSHNLDDPYLRQNRYFLSFLKNDFVSMQ